MWYNRMINKTLSGTVSTMTMCTDTVQSRGVTTSLPMSSLCLVLTTGRVDSLVIVSGESEVRSKVRSEIR